MQLKITSYLLLITCWIVSLRAKALYSKGCYECEEEVWEEVHCEEIPSNSTTVSVPHYTTPSYKITTSTQKPLTTKTTTPHTPTTIKYTTPTSSIVTTTEEPYKKCYCECKVDCKEFCRKVIISPSEKDIVQVSKISETAKNGRLESTHILQREFLPKSSYSPENASDYEPSYNHLRYEASTPTPSKSVLVPKYNGNKYIDSGHYKNYNKPALPTVHYYTKPSSVSLGEPIYHSAKGRDKSYSNVEEYELPYYHRQPPPAVPPFSQSYYSNYNSNPYDFSLPFENAYSGILKAGNPIDYLNAPKHKPKDTNLQHQSSLGNGLNYDDSFDSLIKEFLSNMPSNEMPYESFS